MNRGLRDVHHYNLLTKLTPCINNIELAATAKGQTLKRILCAAKTYKCSSAECERGFSAANNTVTPMRNRLSAKRLASLLFIDLNGPPAASFKPQNQGLKYFKMSTTHREGRWRAEGPERGTESRSTGVPKRWGLGRGAVAPPQYKGLGALPPENFEI